MLITSFFVDGKTGVTLEDYDVVDLLRRTNKTVLLVVNKIDNFPAEDLSDFYALGIGEPIPISSEHMKGVGDLLEFKRKFDAASKRAGKRQFLTYYFIAAHPGCTESDMRELKRFAERELNLRPEQVQIFTPTPLTAATCMYYTGIDPYTGRKVHVARGLGEKQRQKDILTPKNRFANN